MPTFDEAVKKRAGSDEALGVPGGDVGGIPVVTPDDLGPAAAMTPAEVVTDEDAQAALSGAFAALNAGREGTGMPEGVVSAPVGTVYRDLAATNGAVTWVKASGTGNTGWRVVWGDTGWRTITAWDSAGNVTGAALPTDFVPVAGQSGLIRVRRTATMTMLYITGLAVTTYTSQALYTMPPGFRSSAGNHVAAPCNIRGLTAGNPATLLLQPDGVVRRPFSVEWSSAVVIDLALPTWPAEAAWPATLPGSAA